MERIKRVFRLIHLVLWTLFAFLVGLQLSSSNTSDWWSVTIGVVTASMYVFYGHYSLLTRYSGTRNRKDYLVRLAALILTGPVPFLLSHYQKPLTWDVFSDYYKMTVVSLVPMFIFLSWLARVTQNLIMNTIRKEELEKQAVSAELHYLKSQINPHFLFNTLNNIHTLVYKQAPSAPEAVMRLSSLMRYMIYESNALTVPFTRELNYLQDYVSLQQLRYKTTPVVDLEVQGNTESAYIAPLLFIHLLENAYKHSPARLEPGDIKVRIVIQDHALTFRISNPIARKVEHLPEAHGGIGLANVRKRLVLLNPEHHHIDISNTGTTFTVTLTIKDLSPHSHEGKTHVLHH